MRSANRLIDVIGCDGTLQLHLPCTKPPIHYLVDYKTLIFLSGMRKGISNRNQTTRTNTDTGASPKAFYDPTNNREIAILEMGGVGGFNDFVAHLCNMVDLKHAEVTGDSITELTSLIRGKRMGRNSADSAKISVCLADRIAETLIYGK